MSLETLIDETYQFLKTELSKYKNPVLAWSGGKDSTVLLHLLLKFNIRIPIVFYTDPWFRKKLDFANGLASRLNLEIHDYPPLKTSLKHSENMIALVSEYQTGPHSSLAVLKNSLEFSDGDNPDEFLCGLNFLMRPCAIYVFPWDLVLVGHRDADKDQIYGPVPLKVKLLFKDEGPDYCFPLKEWPDDAIWDYTEQFKVPIQTDRYDVANRREWSDKTFNSDWYPVCLRCIDKRLNGQKVFCPKMRVELGNMSTIAPEYELIHTYFGSKG